MVRWCLLGRPLLERQQVEILAILGLGVPKQVPLLQVVVAVAVVAEAGSRRRGEVAAVEVVEVVVADVAAATPRSQPQEFSKNVHNFSRALELEELLTYMHLRLEEADEVDSHIFALLSMHLVHLWNIKLQLRDDLHLRPHRLGSLDHMLPRRRLVQ